LFEIDANVFSSFLFQVCDLAVRVIRSFIFAVVGAKVIGTLGRLCLNLHAPLATSSAAHGLSQYPESRNVHTEEIKSEHMYLSLKSSSFYCF